MKPKKYDEPFYIGGLDIYDFQRKTGFKRWNTWMQSQTSACEELH